MTLGKTQYRHGELGARLRAARTSEGVTQEQAAEICEVPLWEYQSFETGKRLIPAMCLVALEAMKGLDREWILTGATDAQSLLMLPDDRLVATWSSQDPPTGDVASQAAEIRKLIAFRTRTDRTWGASLDLFLEPPAKMVMRDQVQQIAELSFRAGAFAFIAQFAVMVLLMIGMAGGGLEIGRFSGLIAFSMAIWMLIIGLSMIVSLVCKEMEKRSARSVGPVALPEILTKS